MMNLTNFEKLPLMGIMRGIEKADIEPLVETVIGAGLETLEVTMNTQGAPDLIREARKASGGKLTIGAGTVLSEEDLEKALDAGASFIVMPCNIKEVIETCIKRNIPVFPGAFTPTEVWNAHKAGAAMVKVFPSSMFGPKYIKELKGPFNDVKLMAVGGVKLEGIGEYFSNGASAVAFGASVFKKEWLKTGDFKSIGSLVRQYVEAVKEAVG